MGKDRSRGCGQTPRTVGSFARCGAHSLLRRAINTANAALDAANRHWIPVTRTWRLKERHYGDLQGKNKAEAAQDFGDNQVKLWRRSYDTRPPPMRDEAYAAQQADAQYGSIGEQTPRTECLEDVLARMLPFWESDIVPELRGGNTVLVVAHSNS
ncbi:phosphoglycerate mutase [Akanthomyces lecanii RCEF 1005]|uniref:phosphoglycerate mutase (2,3-diphosphoglycerate-dependent) n=1 Tax=Akanthomyces lecanii RCEF 1005 TaxID=1081108 RepID=A0A162LN29_CORDF|nr:phosphoglycerate mutase [Akanthomyces lecanii RCEF 1005]